MSMVDPSIDYLTEKVDSKYTLAMLAAKRARELTVPGQNLPEKDEREAVETITELIEYYKGIFTILSSCAARQLEEVTFRRNTIPVQELFDAAGKYFRKVTKNRTEKVELIIEPMDA